MARIAADCPRCGPHQPAHVTLGPGPTPGQAQYQVRCKTCGELIPPASPAEVPHE